VYLVIMISVDAGKGRKIHLPTEGGRTGRRKGRCVIVWESGRTDEPERARRIGREVERFLRFRRVSQLDQTKKIHPVKEGTSLHREFKTILFWTKREREKKSIVHYTYRREGGGKIVGFQVAAKVQGSLIMAGKKGGI